MPDQRGESRLAAALSSGQMTSPSRARRAAREICRGRALLRARLSPPRPCPAPPAGHHALRVVDNGRREGQAPGRIRGDLDGDHHALGFVIAGSPGRQRRGVAIVAEPSVTKSKRGNSPSPRPKRCAAILVGGSRGRGQIFAAHPMHLVGPERELAEHRAIGHR